MQFFRNFIQKNSQEENDKFEEIEEIETENNEKNSSEIIKNENSAKLKDLDIVLYVKVGCPWSDKMLSFLKENHYEDVRICWDPIFWDQIKNLGGFPLLRSRKTGKQIIGFREQSIEEIIEELSNKELSNEINNVSIPEVLINEKESKESNYELGLSADLMENKIKYFKKSIEEEDFNAIKSLASQYIQVLEQKLIEEQKKCIQIEDKKDEKFICFSCGINYNTKENLSYHMEHMEHIMFGIFQERNNRDFKNKKP